MVIKIKGIIEFAPEDKTSKHRSQSTWKRVAMIRTNCDLDRYYSWFLKKRFNLELSRTLRGTHITFINDRMCFDTFEQAKQIFDGKEITFYYEVEPRTNGEYWWLRVHSPEAESIREAMGLSREPYHPFHLTLGSPIIKHPEGVRSENSTMLIKKDFIEHSHYIMEYSKKFEILSSEPRKPLSEHEIIEF